MKPLTEDEVRAIVQEEMAKNMKAGNPQVPPHIHDGIANLKILQQNIQEFGQLTNASDGVVAMNSFRSSGTSIQQFVGSKFCYLIPQVDAGHLGSFNGGVAPAGTVLVAVETTGTNLWVNTDGTATGWMGVALTLTV